MVDDHLVTRKPWVFAFIVILIILLLYIPIRIGIRSYQESDQEEKKISESYSETMKWFGVDSPLNNKEKRELFAIKYKGNMVSWEGTFVNCEKLQSIWSVTINHGSKNFEDVIFSVRDDCSELIKGEVVKYKMELVDFKVNVFVGKEGKVTI